MTMAARIASDLVVYVTQTVPSGFLTQGKRYRYWYGGVAVTLLFGLFLLVVDLLSGAKFLRGLALDHHALVTSDGLGSL
jgi:hypothetical protein